MTRDELEFAISQYLDGNLAEAEESALEARLASDAEARGLLAEYRSLDRVLRAVPTRQVDFEALSGRIRSAVAEQNEPIQSYRLHWVRTVSALALAACVVIAAGLGIRRMQTPPVNNNEASNTRPQPQAKQIVVVDATTRPTISSAPVAVVSVGPSASPQDRPALARYHEDLLSRPSQVIIARGGYAAQDAPTQDGLLFP
jgi:negative regulator of sigma E activity